MSVQKKKVVDDFDKSAQLYYKELTKLNPLPRLEELDLWEKYKYSNDLNARNRIIESNLKFVASIAKCYKGRGLSYQELVSEGNMGLIKALDKFDEKRGNKIITYSVWWIRQSILEAINKSKQSTNSEEFPADYEEPVENDVTNEKFVEFPVPMSEDEMDKNETNDIIYQLLDGLNDREKRIMYKYFGLNGKKTKTLEEIGNELGLTKERIRQIIEKVLKKMRSKALCNSALDTIYN